jgi:hypothetical protein
MTRWIWASVAAIVAAMVSYGALHVVWRWYEPRFVRSDADISTFILGGLIVQLICVGVASAAAFRRARRRHRH